MVQGQFWGTVITFRRCLCLFGMFFPSMGMNDSSNRSTIVIYCFFPFDPAVLENVVIWHSLPFYFFRHCVPWILPTCTRYTNLLLSSPPKCMCNNPKTDHPSQLFYRYHDILCQSGNLGAIFVVTIVWLCILSYTCCVLSSGMSVSTLACYS